MVKVSSELRQALIDGGRWSSFVSVCERLEGEGAHGSSLVDDAIDELCPDLSRFKRRKKVKMFDVRAEVGDRRRARRAGDSQCNGYRLLEWVVESLEVADVVADDAPSMAAWSVLKAARGDDDVKRDVLKKHLDSRLKLDAAMGDTETRKFDGQAEYDILEGLELEV